MFFIVIIWLFSIGEKLQAIDPPKDDLSDLKNKLNEAKNDMPSLQDYLKNSDAMINASQVNEISPNQERGAQINIPENSSQN